MRIFFVLLIFSFCFQSLSRADKIGDFDIDGISIGESFLKYIGKNIINEKYKSYYPSSKEYYLLEFSKNDLNFLENYSYIGVHFKENDDNFKIYSIKGMLDYDNDLNSCLGQKKIIVNSIKKTLKDSKEEKYQNNFDNIYGNSKSYVSDFKVKNGYVRIWCTDWDKSHDRSKDWIDTLNVDLSKQIFLDWLNTKAYD